MKQQSPVMQGLPHVKEDEAVSSSDVLSLPQLLCESRTENKQLQKAQHRHMMALQHFQDSEDSVSQIVTKHKNEARVLRELLRTTVTSRDKLARQLQATEDKLLKTKETLQQLQLLIQDQNLQERKELTQRLAKASAEMEEKDKRILDLEKGLELCQASFNRQIITEQRKTKEARKISTHLHKQIYQLTKDLAKRERELEKYNIYSHRVLKESRNRDRENKMVQTDGLVLLPTDGTSLVENEYSETGAAGELCELGGAPHVFDEKRETAHEKMAFISNPFLKPTPPKSKEFRSPRFRHTFIRATENLQNGRPAHSNGDLNQHESAKVEILRREISGHHIPDGKTEEGGENSSESE